MTRCNLIYCVDNRDALTHDVDSLLFKIQSQKGTV